MEKQQTGLGVGRGGEVYKLCLFLALVATEHTSPSLTFLIGRLFSTGDGAVMLTAVLHPWVGYRLPLYFKA